MMKKIICTFICAVMVLALTACAGGTDTNLSNHEVQNDNQDVKKSDSAIVYFSVTGHTKDVANLLLEVANADIYEIIPAEEYTAEDIDYNNGNCRACYEQNVEDVRPAIGNDLSLVEEYDVIYIGYPIWLGTNPRIINTFLESYNLEDAKIYLFCTSGGSDIDESLRSLKELYPNLNIISGKNLTGTPKVDIELWMTEAN